MEIQYILERAKDLFEKDKFLMPVIFIETDKIIDIIGIKDFNDLNRKKMMSELGKKYAKDLSKGKILSISMVSEANISRINIISKIMIKTEAITVAKLTIKDNKKEIVIQDFERSDDSITFKEPHYETNFPGIFLLDAFMEGYTRIRAKNKN